ncbi:class F sortase [Actinoplanes sp. DH11]|uniref:class F sortase n=1 Tax=Actinoplanes sp. DH11 TaxID=2857011 RepID=UPI001E3BBF79|nr:class F sortase [Actinoplanes sp. DH11]
MPHIRDRRAAGLAALFAVLGVTSTAMGLRAEVGAPPPVAAGTEAAGGRHAGDTGAAGDGQTGDKDGAGNGRTGEKDVAGNGPAGGTDAGGGEQAGDTKATGGGTKATGSGTEAAGGGTKAAGGGTDEAGRGPGQAGAGQSRDGRGDEVSDDALPAPPRARATTRPASGMRRSEPRRLEIPAIGLRTPLAAVGLHDDGTLEVPPLRADAPAGWYRHSVTPGEAGAAVIIGHVDTAREGPAVFFRLRELGLGDTVGVRRADGTVAEFEVYRVASYPKDAFPSGEVYGSVDRAELRLITCGGSFDRKQRTYRDNVVVFAAPRRKG